MRFWDTSALVPLLISESGSASVRALAIADPGMLVWWATEVECVSALTHAEQAHGFEKPAGAETAFRQLQEMTLHWEVVEPTPSVRRTAIRLLRTHRLRAADALQLSAALVVCGHEPDGFPLVTLDKHLAAAAGQEGFAVLP